MFGSIALVTVPTIVIAEAAHRLTGSSLLTMIGAIAALFVALGVIARALHLPELRKGLLHFLRFLNGEPESPGIPARKGLPERLDEMETSLTRVRVEMQGQSLSLTDLAETSIRNGEKIDRLDQRVTDHRRRNDEQADILRAELDRRAEALEHKLDTRNQEVDDKLNSLAEDVFRAQAGRAILHELGMKIEPHDPDDPLAGAGP